MSKHAHANAANGRTVADRIGEAALSFEVDEAEELQPHVDNAAAGVASEPVFAAVSWRRASFSWYAEA